MPLEKQAVSVNFGSLEQKVDSKLTLPGSLALAENVQQDQTRSYVKRLGYSVVDRAASSGGMFPVSEMSANVSGVVISTSIAQKGRIFTRSPGLAEWERVEEPDILPLLPDARPVNASAASLPSHVRCSNGLIYVFSQRKQSTGPISETYVSIYELSTGLEVVPPQNLTFSGVPSGRNVYAAGTTTGTDVWFFSGPGTSGNQAGVPMLAHKMDASNPSIFSAVVTTTYLTFGAGTTDYQGFDVSNKNGEIVLCLYGTVDFGSGARTFAFSRLNPLTGTPKTSGYTWGSVNTSSHLHPHTIIQGTSTDIPTGKLYSMARTTAGALAILNMDFTAGSVTTTTISLSAGFTTDQGICAFMQSPTEIALLWSQFSGGATDIDSTFIGKHTTTLAGAALVGPLVRSMGSAFTSTLPFQIPAYGTSSNDWFVGIAQDDNGAGLQGSYGVYTVGKDNSFVNIMHMAARTLYGRGGTAWHRGDGFQNTATTKIRDFNWHTNVTIDASNRKFMFFGASRSGPGTEFALMSMEWDSLATVAPPSQALDGNQLVWPSGWMHGVSGGRLLDLSPSMFPPKPSLLSSPAGSLPAGTYQVCAVYAVRDTAGNVVRSAPSQALSFVASGVVQATFSVRNLRLVHYIGFGQKVQSYYIEFYSTLANGTTFFLHSTTENVADIISLGFTLSAAPVAGAETLYTTGGILDNTPAPPFHGSFEFNNRTFLYGTDTAGELWFSKEYKSGFGVEFNDTLRLSLRGGSGHILSGGPIDDDRAVLFKRDIAFLLTGQGPDLMGRGNYRTSTLTLAQPCANPRSTVTTPYGLMYQAVDGSIWLLGRNLESVFIGKGVDSFKSDTVVGANHLPSQCQVRFAMASGNILVFDYKSPSSSTSTVPGNDTLGQWYVWRLGLPDTLVASSVVAGVHNIMRSDGQLLVQKSSASANPYQDDVQGSSVSVLPKIKTNPMSLSGLQGYQRLYRGQFLGTFSNGHTFRLTVDTDFGAGEGGTSENWTRAVAGNPQSFEFRPSSNKKPTAIEVTIESTVASATGADFSFDGLALEIGVKPGMRRLGTGQRLT